MSAIVSAIWPENHYADFVHAAKAEVAKHDAARARAELLAAGDPADFTAWAEDWWESKPWRVSSASVARVA